MKLLSLDLRNFRQHAETHVDFPPEGVVGIVGSNEGGKSTLLEGAAFALFGTRAIRGTKSSLRWNRAPARRVAQAELLFEVGGERYLVIRSESDASVSTGGQIIAQGTSAVDAYIPEVIGMSLPEFEATYLCSQGQLARISSMGPTERQTFFRNVMGVGRIDDALKACRARRNDLKTEAGGLREGLGDREPLVHDRDAARAAERGARGQLEVRAARRDALREEYGAVAAKLEASQATAERHRQLKEDQRAAVREQEAAEKAVHDVVEQLHAAVLAQRKVDAAAGDLARLPAARTEREQLLEAQARAGERETLTGVRDAAATAVATIEELIPRLTASAALLEEDSLAPHQRRVEDVEARLSKVHQDRTQGRAKALEASATADKEARKAQQKLNAITNAGEAGACPTCRRRLGEQLEPVLEGLRSEFAAATAVQRQEADRARALSEATQEEKDLEAQLAMARAAFEREQERRRDAAYARSNLADAQAQLEVRRRELHQVEAKLAALPEAAVDGGQLEAVTAEISRLEALDRDLTAARALAARRPELEHARDQRHVDLEAARERLTEIGRALGDLGFLPELHYQLQASAGKATQELQAAEVEHARAEELVRAAAERAGRADAALAEYDARAGRLRGLLEDLRVHEAAAARLDAFREAEVAGIRPELEELTSGFVSLLTDGRHEAVTLTDDFDVVLYESGLPVEVVSGGTRDIASIALRLATSQMIAERAGKPLSLLILDEPFGSLDEVRRGNVLNLIRRLGGIFEQTIVISHVSETKDAVDHIIEVEFDEAAGCSRVSGPPAVDASPALAGVAA